MGRRREPVRISDALAEITEAVQPRTPLARIQAAWPAVAGATLARWAEPVSERAGIVTFSCSDSMVAHELEMMKPALLQKLADALPQSPPGELRFVIR